MKLVLYIGAALLGLVGILVAVYWSKIQDVRALMAYSAVFEPETIDENFRTLYTTYPSVAIPRGGDVAEFDVALRDDVFPETYEYEGKKEPLAPLLDEFNWTGIAVMHGGQLIHEAYDRGNSAESVHIEMSVTKSLTSILFGIAWDEGAIPDLDALVTDYVPELKGSGYDGVTIQQVLDMTSGIRYIEDYADLESDIVLTVVAMLRGSLDEFSTTIVNLRDPGSFNQYASIETQVLAWVLRKATGKSYAQYFQEKLWSRVGAEADVQMLTDAIGEPVAFGGAHLRLRDLARVGQMVLNGGVSMTGERVVSEEWLRRSVTTDTPQSKPGEHGLSDYPLGYKNQWWIPVDRDGGDFTAIGIYGQFLYVNPERNVVIALNSAYPDYNEKPETELKMVNALQAIARHVSP